MSEKHLEPEEHRLDTDSETDWIASWLNLRGEVEITICKTIEGKGSRRGYYVRIEAPEVGVDVDASDDSLVQAIAVVAMFGRQQIADSAADNGDGAEDKKESDDE